MRSFWFPIVLLASASAAQSQESEMKPTPPMTEQEETAYLNRQSLALAERGPAQGWSSTASGVRWRRVKGDGSGRRPTPADRVTAHYAGSFIDGSEFDNSYKRGEPITFPFGMVIQGWQDVMALAGIGDVIEAAIPSSVGYGPKGKGPIPGGATLLFTIEIVAVNGPEDAQ